jgi:hypothetical protein
VGKLKDALRKKYRTPREALRALGLDEKLLDVKRLAFDGANMKPTRLEFLITTRAARAINPLLAKDAKIEMGPIFKGLTTKNLKERKAKIVTDIAAAIKGKTIAKDASIEHVAHMLDQLEHVDEPKSLDESVSEPQHKAMEAAAHGQSNLGIPKDVGKEFSEADKGKSFGDMIRDWAMSKDWAGGMSEDDFEAIKKMHEDAMPDDLPENALDETPEEKEAREKKEKEAKDKKAADEAAEAEAKAKDTKAMDERLKGMVTTDAMNNAIKAAVDTVTKNAQDTAEARAFVRPYVGEVSMALDTADKVLRAAAVSMEIDDAENIHPSALKTVIKTCGRLSGAREVDGDQHIGQDSAAAKSFAERFPGADRIGTA